MQGLQDGKQRACIRACIAEAQQGSAELGIAGSKGYIRTKEVQSHHCKTYVDTQNEMPQLKSVSTRTESSFGHPLQGVAHNNDRSN